MYWRWSNRGCIFTESIHHYQWWSRPIVTTTVLYHRVSIVTARGCLAAIRCSISANLVELQSPKVVLEAPMILAGRVPAFAQRPILVRIVKIQPGDDLQCILLLDRRTAGTLGPQRFGENSLQILALRWAWFAAQQTVNIVRNQPIAAQNGVNVQIVISCAIQRSSHLLRFHEVEKRQHGAGQKPNFTHLSTSDS